MNCPKCNHPTEEHDNSAGCMHADSDVSPFCPCQTNKVELILGEEIARLGAENEKLRIALGETLRMVRGAAKEISKPTIFQIIYKRHKHLMGAEWIAVTDKLFAGESHD